MEPTQQFTIFVFLFPCFCSIFALAFVEIWLFLAARWRKFCHFAFPKIQIELHFPFSPDYRQHINSNLNSCNPVPLTHIWVWEILLLLFSKAGSGTILDQPDKEEFRYLTKIIVLPSSISHEIASLRLNKPFSSGRRLQKLLRIELMQRNVTGLDLTDKKFQ